MDLYAHQEEAVRKLHNGSILWGGVGVGKSRVAMEYYIRKEAPKDLYIITTAKKRDSLDWEGEAAGYAIGKTKDETVAGVLTVDSWNNLHKYVGTKDAFFIFDEQRLVGSGQWTKAFIKISKDNTWILLTATPGDTWLDYISVFVANGLYKNRTAFKREHVVYNHFSKFPKVERYIGVGTLVRHRNNLLVEMPYEKHTIKHVKDIWVDYDKDLLHRALIDRWHVYEDRPLRDVGELFQVMRKIVNSDVSRLDTVRRIMLYHPRIIIFYSFDYELEILRCLSNQEETQAFVENQQNATTKTAATTQIVPREGAVVEPVLESSSLRTGSFGKNPSFALAEWNSHKHEIVPDTDSWVYLVQYVAGAEGWNCTSTDTSVFYSQTYSYKNLQQAMGRIDRLNTPFTHLYYYMLKSKSGIDLAISKSLSSKKNFNNSSFGFEL